jgi:hypothetical protein
LLGLSDPRPQDYINYLESVSVQSKRIVYPQLHVTISTKGHDHTKQELTAIAEKWLDGMGYGKQPYLIVFHKDTKNNHVHLVSTRISRDGKKINDSYEWKRAYEVLNRIMGITEASDVKKHVNQALEYQFATRAQFMMLLEAKGYTLKLKEEAYQVIKYGKVQATVPLADVDRQLGKYQVDKKRLQQLRAIVEKYRAKYSPRIFPERSSLPGGRESKITGYNSELANKLRNEFGVQVLFHSKDGKPPYGYTVIDHTKKAVYKGSLLMPLAEFIEPVQQKVSPPLEREPSIEPKAYFVPGDRPFDPPGDQNPTDVDLNFTAPEFTEATTYAGYLPHLQLDIADDIDDEQINGRNRRRKRTARVNKR